MKSLRRMKIMLKDMLRGLLEEARNDPELSQEMRAKINESLNRARARDARDLVEVVITTISPDGKREEQLKVVAKHILLAAEKVEGTGIHNYMNGDKKKLLQLQAILAHNIVARDIKELYNSETVEDI
jgi:hypothetical protein